MPVAPPIAPTTDPAVAHPELLVLRTALRLDDWPTFRARLAGQEPGARTRLIRLAAEGYARPEVPAGLLAADPTDTLAAAVLGTHTIDLAWQARTSARADQVSRERFTRFREILRDAERMLIDTAAHDPGDPAIWVLRLITCRGLELGQSEARRRYDRLAEQDPHHLPGQVQLLQQLCPKWGGSFEAAHDFARSAMLAAPAGAHNAVLVVEAHLEHLFDLDGAEQRRYRADPALHAQIHEAAQRSVLHPAFRQTVGWVGVQNTFAMMFTLIDAYPVAATLFAQLGHLVSEDPWDFLGDPVTKFTEFRQRAYQRAGVR